MFNFLKKLLFVGTFCTVGLFSSNKAIEDQVVLFLSSIHMISSCRTDLSFADGCRVLCAKDNFGSVLIEVQYGTLAFVVRGRVVDGYLDIDKIDFFDRGIWKETVGEPMNGYLYIRGLQNMPLFLYSGQQLVNFLRSVVLYSLNNRYDKIRYEDTSLAILENSL